MRMRIICAQILLLMFAVFSTTTGSIISTTTTTETPSITTTSSTIADNATTTDISSTTSTIVSDVSTTTAVPNVSIDFSAIMLNAIVVQSPPFVIRKNDFDQYFGFFPELLETMAHRFNFSYQLSTIENEEKIESVDDTNDNNNSSSSTNDDDILLDKLMTIVEDGKVDIALADMPITESRQEKVQFTEPCLKINLAALIHRSDLDPEFGTIEQLIEYNKAKGAAKKIKYGVVQGSTADLLLRQEKHKNPTAQTIFTSIQSNKQHNVSSVHAALELVQKAKFALFVDALEANAFALFTDCHSIAVVNSATMFTRQYGFILPKQTLLLKQMNQAIEQLEKDGTIALLKADYFINLCLLRHNSLLINSTPTILDSL